VDVAPVELMAALIDAAFVVGLRIAMPVLLMATLASLAMGVLMRTIPQINIMTIGFAIQIVLGMSVMVISIYAVGDVATEAIADFLGHIHDWVRSLGDGNG
jgi:flagellar biosynthetic protein FliR